MKERKRLRRKAGGAVAWVLALVLAAAPLTAGNAAADAFDDGYAAYQRLDFAQAMKIWLPLAEQGHARAQFNVGLMYDEGRGVGRDNVKARRWWLKAAENDFPEALHNLASSYLFGSGGTDHEMAVEWMTRAAGLGLARSQYTLGKMYLVGLGVDKDPAGARAWIEKAALQGDPRAQYNMGKLSRDGIGAPEDKVKAALWFLQAAEQGYAKAQNHIGLRYAKGDGIIRDDERALFWLILAAGQGHIVARTNRDSVAARLAAATVTEVEARAKAWKPGQTF